MVRATRLGALLSLCLLADCRQPARNSGLRVVSSEHVHQGVTFLHLEIAAVDPSTPLVIALHGRGSSPDGFASAWRDFPSPIEIALPQGFERFRFGWQWFDWPWGMDDGALTTAISAAEAKLCRRYSRPPMAER